MSVVVFFGAPGSGKGTQAKFLSVNAEYIHISTGDLLRECKNDITHPLNAIISSKMASGQLIDDDVVNGIISHKISQIKLENVIFDGYPRTVNQAVFLQEELAKYSARIQRVIFFDINPDIVVERIVNREVCKKCGTIFNKKFNKSKQDGICDACGGILENRIDDNEEVIRKRIAIYNDSSKDLLEFYHSVVTVVDASKNEHEITNLIKSVLWCGKMWSRIFH